MLLYANQTSDRHIIFNDIKEGDAVEFYVDGNLFPCNGTISIQEGIIINTFNTLLNKWEYYSVE